MKYKQSIIDIIGEEKVKEFLLQGESIPMQPVTEKEVLLKNAMEHYIVKHYNTEQDPQLKKMIASRLKLIKFRVLLTPAYASQTYICKPGIIQEMYSESELNELVEIINVRWHKEAKEIYEKYKSGNKLTSSEKSSLSSFFIYTYDNASEQIKTARKDYIKSLLQENKIPQTQNELELVLKYSSDFTLGEYKSKVSPDIFVTLLDKNSTLGYYTSSTETIYINLTTHSKTLDDYIQTVCHETRHSIQNYMAKQDPESRRSLDYAMRRIFPQNEYTANYRYSEIEEDANKNGYDKCASIYSLNGFYDIGRQVRDKKEKFFKNTHFEYEHAALLDQFGNLSRFVAKEKYNVLRLNDALKRNPEYINEYPVLGKLYNKDGSPKELSELLSTPFKILESNKYEVYQDHIYTYIRSGKLSEIDFQSFDEEHKRNIRGHLQEIYKKEAQNVAEIINNKEFGEKIGPKGVKAILTYRLDILDKIGQFMDRNYYEFSTEEERVKANRDGTSFVLYNSVGNYRHSVEILLNSMKLKSENIPEYAKPYIIQTQKNYKRMMITDALVHIRNELKNYAKEELKTPVTLKNGNKISFEQYAEEFISSSAVYGRNTRYKVENGDDISLKKYLKRVLNDAKKQMQEEVKQNSNQPNLTDREQALQERERLIAEREAEIEQTEKQLQAKKTELEQLQKELDKREQTLLVREQELSERENKVNNHSSSQTEELVDMANQILEQYSRENQQSEYISQSNGKSR